MKGPGFEGDEDLASSKEFCATIARMLEQLGSVSLVQRLITQFCWTISSLNLL